MSDYSCEQVRELMAAGWKRELDETASARLQEHLDGCRGCAADMASLSGIWEKLGDLPAPEPGLALRLRWEQTLESFVSGQPVTPGSHRWLNFWPSNPAWQMAIAVLCLGAGLGAGVWMERGSSERDEVSRLREEVAETREMVALSLLQQQSATERLRGVDYSASMPSMEPRITDALIQAVNRDSSVNVRLAAIDALGKAANNAHVRDSIRDSLAQQDSPMVQEALIDFLLDAHDKASVSAIQNLVSQPDVNPAVRTRATYAVQHLTQ